MSAEPFIVEWRRFVAAARMLCELYGAQVINVYRPAESGIASLIFAPGLHATAQMWKVVAALRKRGWIVKVVRGKVPTMTVDLNDPPLEEVQG